MAEGEGAKAYLYAWLGKKGLVPEYNIRSSGAKQRSRFLCELTVEGYPYRGAGNSTNKKDAQTNAAKDFIQYLVRTGNMNNAEIPPSVLAYQPPTQEPVYPQQHLDPQQNQQQPVFRSGAPGDMGEVYRPYSGQEPDFDAINAKNVAEAEGLDVNASLHGNWTIENAKGRLHQFFQMNKINADYTYSAIGPAHTRSFQAECKVYIKQLGRYIYARETGSNKQTASKSCALSLVRQLYHLKVIEAFSGTLKQPKATDGVKPFEVKVDPSLMQIARLLLDELNIPPPSVTPSLAAKPEAAGENSEEGPLRVNLIREARKDLSFLTKNEENSKNAGIISWSPPVPNWNTWTGSNIDEGHMASASLDQLSDEFLQSFKEMQQVNQKVQDMYKVRCQLPVYSKKNEIMERISEYPIVLIKGDTGSGKTTQICQFILDDYILSGQGAYCNVIVTQPRRISAISVAERIANERGEELGMTVGYSVRFESCLPRPYASILFCTVGVLLRKLEGGLRGVSHVIVDEIHERDVNTDFILIVLRDMLATYPDLRVILMSATIDDTLFTEYFNGCPVVQVEGRAFPVETHFLEDIVETLQFTPSPESIRTAKKKRQEDKELGADTVPDENLNIVPLESGYSQQTQATLKLLNERDINLELLTALLTNIKQMQIPGAILVFLPGWNLIFTVMRYLQTHPVFGSSSYVILPLHSQLPREDQHKVFDPVPANMTKIILSTNIAETSVTIDDVVFVIDSCKSKTKLFTSHNNMTTFVQDWASRSNLLQRRGRAGRVRQGYCFHLLSRARYDALEENMSPEIFRTPLHEIALSIKLLRLGGISQFLSKAPQAPPLDAVIEAQALLYDLNCLDSFGELTSLGRILAKMPLDPRLGKMIILGTIFGCADALAVISASASNMSEVFNLGPENRRLAPQQRGFGANRHSDHFAMLNAFQQCIAIRDRRGEDAQYEFCQERLLSLPSVRMTCDAKNQLLQVLSACDFPDEVLLPVNLNFRSSDYELDTIAAVLCSGLYPNVCYHAEKRKVLTTESKLALIHKASINCSRYDCDFPFPFFIFGEKIRTRAITCKQMTMVTPIHLLLFGARKVELVQDTIVLDGWINLKMNPQDAAVIVSLRPAIENMISLATENPEGFFPLNPENEKLVTLVRDLSRLEAAKFGEDVRAPRGNHGGGAYHGGGASYAGGYQPSQGSYQNPEDNYGTEEDVLDSGDYASESFDGSEEFDNGNGEEGNGNGSIGIKRSGEAALEDEFAAKRGRFDAGHPREGGGFRGAPRPLLGGFNSGGSGRGFSGPRFGGFQGSRGVSARFSNPRFGGGGFSRGTAGGGGPPRFGRGGGSRFGGGGAGFQPRGDGRGPRFFSTNRGGWNPRGTTGAGGPPRGRGGPHGFVRPRQNYPY